MLVGAVALVAAALALTSSPALAAGGPLKPQTLKAAKPQTVKKARPSIVNGAPIAIAAAPWQVYVGTSTLACGGVILNSTQVLTAAHCVFTPANAPIAASAFTVAAGVSNLTSPAPGDVLQTTGVTSIRVHPGYVAAAAFPKPDDVAVLQLKTALNLTGPTARPIPLVAATPGPGTPATLTGFGRQNPVAQPDGKLYSLGTTVVDPLSCAGPDNALIVCMSTPGGSACMGDSGGPMTVGAPAVLAGVSSFGAGEPPCQVGSMNAYANLAAPELAAFVAGSNTPPLAPRGGTDVSGRGVFQAGQSMTCNPGTWTNNPTFAFTVADAAGAVLQSGPSATYVFTAADVGRSIACRVAATTAGGTGAATTVGSPAIAPAPAPRLSVSVRGPSRRVKLGGAMKVAIRVSNKGQVTAQRVKVCAGVSRGMGFKRVPKKTKRAGRRARCLKTGNLAAGRAKTVRFTVRVPSRKRIRVAKTVATVSAANAATAKATLRLVRRRG